MDDILATDKKIIVNYFFMNNNFFPDIGKPFVDFLKRSPNTMCMTDEDPLFLIGWLN